jgi:enoyl-CoA hydratase
MAYEYILTERKEGVGLITLNRPTVHNALSSALIEEIGHALDAMERDEGIGASIITGGEKVFAAGADIKEMSDLRFSDIFLADFPNGRDVAWRRFSSCRKPIIAAVAGFALGGGCELAMACDFIIAAETAKFGQPEINLATMPGAGGTQRLTRIIGKSKAMEMCLTGRFMDAAEAERAGLVARVVPVDKLMEETWKIAVKIASQSRPTVMMVKEAVNVAYETFLAEGLRFERRTFQSTFATEDMSEGMAAFSEKRKPIFKNK